MAQKVFNLANFNGNQVNIAAIIQEFQLTSLNREDFFQLSFQDVLEKSGLSFSQFCVLHRLYERQLRVIIQNNPNYSFFQIMGLYLQGNHPSFVSNINHYHGVSYQAICIKYQLNYSVFRGRWLLKHSFHDILGHAILFTPFFPSHIIPKLLPYIEQVSEMSYEQFKEFCLSGEVNDELVNYFILFYQKLIQVKDALNVYLIVDFVTNGYLRVPAFWDLSQAEIMEKFSITDAELEHYYREFYQDYETVICKNETCWVYSRRKFLSHED